MLLVLLTSGCFKNTEIKTSISETEEKIFEIGDLHFEDEVVEEENKNTITIQLGNQTYTLSRESIVPYSDTGMYDDIIYDVNDVNISFKGTPFVVDYTAPERSIWDVVETMRFRDLEWDFVNDTNSLP